MIIIIKNTKNKISIFLKKKKILFVYNFKKKNITDIKKQLSKIKFFCDKIESINYKYNGVSKHIIDYILSWKIN